MQPVPVIPEIDIWRAANLMLKRYGDKALEESAARGDELAAQDDYSGEAGIVDGGRVDEAIDALSWHRPRPCSRPRTTISVFQSCTSKYAVSRRSRSSSGD